MKTTFFALCFLCSTAAFGQAVGSISSVPQPTAVPDHPIHASEHAMAQETTLFGSSPYTYAQGEQPLWEFGSPTREVPLGDVARAYRKGHVVDKKAVVVMDNN